MGTVCRKKAGRKNFFQQLKIQRFGPQFEDENLNQKKSAWARMLPFFKDLTPVMKKSQKYLPRNFSKGTFFCKDRLKPFWPTLTGNECFTNAFTFTASRYSCLGNCLVWKINKGGVMGSWHARKNVHSSRLNANGSISPLKCSTLMLYFFQ